MLQHMIPTLTASKTKWNGWVHLILQSAHNIKIVYTYGMQSTFEIHLQMAPITRLIPCTEHICRSPLPSCQWFQKTVQHFKCVSTPIDKQSGTNYISLCRKHSTTHNINIQLQDLLAYRLYHGWQIKPLSHFLSAMSISKGSTANSSNLDGSNCTTIISCPLGQPLESHL